MTSYNGSAGGAGGVSVGGSAARMAQRGKKIKIQISNMPQMAQVQEPCRAGREMADLCRVSRGVLAIMPTCWMGERRHVKMVVIYAV